MIYLREIIITILLLSLPLGFSGEVINIVPKDYSEIVNCQYNEEEDVIYSYQASDDKYVIYDVNLSANKAINAYIRTNCTKNDEVVTVGLSNNKSGQRDIAISFTKNSAFILYNQESIEVFNIANDVVNNIIIMIYDNKALIIIDNGSDNYYSTEFTINSLGYRYFIVESNSYGNFALYAAMPDNLNENDEIEVEEDNDENGIGEELGDSGYEDEEDDQAIDEDTDIDNEIEDEIDQIEEEDITIGIDQDNRELDREEEIVDSSTDEPETVSSTDNIVPAGSESDQETPKWIAVCIGIIFLMSLFIILWKAHKAKTID